MKVDASLLKKNEYSQKGHNEGDNDLEEEDDDDSSMESGFNAFVIN
jgi:hypothetical protein